MSTRTTLALAISTALLAAAAPATAQPGMLDPSGALDARIAETLAEIERSDGRRARVEAEMSSLGEREDAAETRMRARTRALYRLTRAGMLPISGGFTALLGHLSRVERLERLVVEDARALAELSRHRDALEAETGQLGRSVESARVRLAALEADKERFDRAALDQSVWDSAFSSGFGDSGSFDLDAMRGGIRVLDEEGGTGPSFAAQRGRLGLPVAGTVDLRPAQRGDGEGIDVLCRPGTSVLAVDDGRVAWADHHGAYGLMVIVDHGEGYFTVYAGLSQAAARAGDHVSRGARIALAGPEGVFFQVRQGTRALDAAAWLGL